MKNELDIQQLFVNIWTRKLLIFKTTTLFILFGLLIAFTSPKEYVSSSTLIPEESESSLISSSIGGLASLAGVDLSSLSDAGATISPVLYESVSKSTPFLKELMEEEFFVDKLESKVTLYDYLLEHQQKNLLGMILSIPKALMEILVAETEEENRPNVSEGIEVLTKDQEAIAEEIMNRMQVYVDWEINVVVINTEMQDPVVSAEVNRFTMKYMTDYVTRYSMAKVKDQLEFVSSQFETKKRDFEKAQMDLALFRDRNKNVTTSTAKSEEELLKSRYDIAFGVYSQLAQQLETITLQLNERIPVFTVLEPPRVATDNHKPNKALILISSVMSGLFISITFIIFIEKIKPLIKKD